MSVITKDLGAATAYGYAVEKGYTGTEAEFAELMASYASVAQSAAASATAAAGSATSAASSASTASGSATSAAASATTASGKASEAATAATTATTAKTDAVAAKTAAETAQTAAETAQGLAEDAQAAAEDAAESVSTSAAQIATNTSDISDLKSDFTQIKTTSINGKYPFNVPSWNPLGLSISSSILDTLYVSKIIIPAHTYIKRLTLKARYGHSGYICFYDPVTLEVVKKISFSYDSNSYKTIDLDYITDSAVSFGVCANGVYFGKNTTSSNMPYTFTGEPGLFENSTNSVEVGDTLDMLQSDNNRLFIFGLSMDCYRLLPDVETKWYPNSLQTKGGIKYADISEQYGFVGRWYEKTVNDTLCYVTNNSGSQVFFKTHGATSVTLLFENMSETNNYYAYSIDGGPIIRKSISDNTITLSDGEHIIRLIMDGITEHIDKWENGIGYAFKGCTVDTPAFITGVLPTSPSILFMGDSITEGIRALGTSDDMGDTNSASNSFPYFCCDTLNCVPFMCGYGATGIGNAGSFNKADYSAKFLYQGKTVYRYYPDMIVLNYGQNDSSMESANFITTYESFITTLNNLYPGVPILVMIPFSQRHASDIATICEDNTSLICVDTSTWTDITYTDGVHPNAEGAEIAGNHLATFIQTLL